MLLKAWLADRGQVAKPWVVISAAISFSMLAAIYLCATYWPNPQSVNESYTPLFTTRGDFSSVLNLMKANLMVLAIYVVACVAVWMVNVRIEFAPSRQALQSAVCQLTIGLVTALIIFAIGRQIIHIAGNMVAASNTLDLPVLTLMARASLHGLFELTAIFLPLGALILLGRRRQWDQLPAAAALSTIVAIPMLLIAAGIETWVTGGLF